MTPRPLILIGGGEHARVVADAALSSGQWDIVGVVDPAPAAETLTNRLQVVAPRRRRRAARARSSPSTHPTRPWLVVAVGAVVDGRVRQQVAGRFAAGALGERRPRHRLGVAHGRSSSQVPS